MLVRLKLYKSEILQVRLKHPHNEALRSPQVARGRVVLAYYCRLLHPCLLFFHLFTEMEKLSNTSLLKLSKTMISVRGFVALSLSLCRCHFPISSHKSLLFIRKHVTWTKKKEKKLFVSTPGQIRDKDEQVVMFGNGRKHVPKNKNTHSNSGFSGWILISSSSLIYIWLSGQWDAEEEAMERAQVCYWEAVWPSYKERNGAPSTRMNLWISRKCDVG